MPVITIFSSVFCRQEPVVAGLMDRTGYRRVTDDDVVGRAVILSGMDEKKIRSAYGAKKSVFNKFTHERERATAWLGLAMAEMMEQDDMIIEGFSGLLIPEAVTHVLRVCMIAEVKFRVAQGRETQGLTEKEAMHDIHKADEDRAAWVQMLFKTRDPWDPSLYDIIIPTDKTDSEASIELIEENLRSEVIRPTESSRRAAKDYILAAKARVALAKEGHNVEVSARDGKITITINENVLMLNRLEEELKDIVTTVPGVTSVETRIGKGFHRADIYRKFDFDVPKLLLVDDEREFVHTLSERLLMRDLDSAVAYDGETALDILDKDEPEVMILDLKMPGIDGIEVLRKTKATRPEVEVIILTGHGTEKDRETCMELGAFAYLQKPVDIDVLTDTLNRANQKMKQNRAK
jgi:two-component system, OmpR family, response regulator CpxR